MSLLMSRGASSTETLTLPSPGSERSINWSWMVSPFSSRIYFELWFAHSISTLYGQRFGISWTPMISDTDTSLVISQNISLTTLGLSLKFMPSVANWSIRLDSIFQQQYMHNIEDNIILRVYRYAEIKLPLSCSVSSSRGMIWSKLH